MKPVLATLFNLPQFMFTTEICIIYTLFSVFSPFFVVSNSATDCLERLVSEMTYSVSQKNPPDDLCQFFQNGWEFFTQILHAYYAFLSMQDYEFLFNYLQL